MIRLGITFDISFVVKHRRRILAVNDFESTRSNLTDVEILELAIIAKNLARISTRALFSEEQSMDLTVDFYPRVENVRKLWLILF